MNKLEKLNKKIAEIKKKDVPTKNINSRINGKNYSMAINVSIELMTGIGLGVFFGLIVDNYLQTKPIMFIIFFILGTIVGFYNMYKTLKRYGYFKNDER